MDENIFWIRFWQTVAAAFCVLVSVIGGCTAYESSKIAEMVKGGANPMDARCSMSPGNSVAFCAVRAAAK